MKIHQRTLITAIIVGLFFLLFKYLIINHSHKRYIVILPHHLITEQSITKYYQQLQQKLPRIDTIVLIGPNHYNQGSQFFESFPKQGSYCYNLGQQETCHRGKKLDFFQSELSDFPTFKKEKSHFIVKDHSIGIYISFIKQYFKHITSLYGGLLRIDPSYTKQNDKLVEQLLQYPRKGNTLFIFSVDFSHHMPENIAIFHDQKTLDTLNKPSKEFGPIEVDCPNCLYVAKKIAEFYQKPYFNLFTRTSVYSITHNTSPYDNTSHILGEFSSTKIEKNIRTSQQTIIKLQTGSLEKSTTDKLYTIMFGDSHLGRGRTHNHNTIDENLRCLYHGYDANKQPHFRHNRLLYSFDIAGINFESALCETGYTIPTSKSVTIRTNPDTIKYLHQAGINMINLANNHSYDFGLKCYNRGKKILQDNHIQLFGDGRYGESEIIIKELPDRKVAFVGFNEIGELINRDEKIQKIKDLSTQGYLIIVNVHRGIEYQTIHNLHQKEIAHALADAGATIIIGHHPHVVQDREIYHHVPIFYSLGNFLFDQPQTETLSGMGVMFTLSPQEIVLDTLHFQRDSSNYSIKCNSFH